MKVTSNIRTYILSILLIALAIPAAFAQTQTSGVALQRGYRTGYSDGYMSGYRDTIDSLARNYTRHQEYSSADRAYSKEYGTLDDYRDGYQQGFETGYQTGYDRRSFESALPSGLRKRGIIAMQNPTPDVATVGNINAAYSDNSSQNDTAKTPDSFQQTSNAIIVIPRDTELILELSSDLDTSITREGDKFTAKIVSPSEIAGAVIEGRVAKVLKPGRLKRRSELLLAFDRIILSDSRWANFSATLTEVMAVKGDNVSRVDNEGTALGQSSIKSDVIKVGGATGAGLVVGAVVAGPVGAAVGAGMGAAFGVGAVVIDRGKHIRLNKNQQLRVKTAHETQIR